MQVNDDKDIKIVGDKPSVDVKRNLEKMLLNKTDEQERVAAKTLGNTIAKIFSSDAANFKYDDEGDYDMIIQRRLLLSFTATVSFERYLSDDTDIGIAQKAFLDYLKMNNPEIWRTSSDTGAFSFYYLAYRRGAEIERRIGQTFAMLCSHDGDNVYQELGEALYCWFSSVVKENAEKLGLN